MVELLYILSISFFFSFLGSIPPGSINLSVIQLSLQGNRPAAYRFAWAAALVEFPYTLCALYFEGYLSSRPWVQTNLTLIATLVMLTLGISGLYLNRKPSTRWEKFRNSGFRKGLLISLLNPLAIPFWIGVTAWLRSEGLIQLPNTFSFILYSIGVSLGTFALLAVLAIAAAPIGLRFSNHPAVRLAPSFIFLVLGLYSLLKLLI